MKKHTKRTELQHPFQHERYNRDTDWLDVAVGAVLVLAGCAIAFAIFEAISIVMIHS